MKRKAHFFEPLCAYDHLYRAYRKARRGTRRTDESTAFAFFQENELLLIQSELQSGAYMPGPYRYFTVHDPKRRTIAVAPFRDRVVHHAVVSLLEPLYERCFIHHSYATRKEKGTHAAVFQAQQFLAKNAWYLKMDLEKFFDSVDQNRLLGFIHNKVKDKPFLSVVEKIIRNGGNHGLGLPIGNLTSQFFANVYLNVFDHWVLQHCKPSGYVRYMDDFVLFGPSKQVLKDQHLRVTEMLHHQLAVRIKNSETRLHPQGHGLPFLGVRIFPNILRFLPSHTKRLRRSLQMKHQMYHDDVITETEWLATLNSYNAHLSVYHTGALRQQIFDLME
ncbi:MAG: group II intron reverse transcriptase domain-containing protein [Saprospiraceae bacterium]|nr:group II intron reverse transcriptase domain-containing protein [Saprospiraceae bacterium]